MKKMKVSFYLLVAIMFAFGAAMAFSTAAFAQEGEDEDAFGNIMHTSYIKIKSVDFAAPPANAPCKVTVKTEIIGGEDEDEMPTVKAGKITYITGGDIKTKATADLTCTGDTCTGDIPGAAAGAKVTFAVSVSDSNGNTTAQALPVASADNAAAFLTPGVADMDNSPDIVPDNMDLLNLSASYDKDRIYVGYTVQGKLDGGTIDPPYIQLYGIKVSNPDIEQNEGLMVGKLWVNLPLAKDKAVQDKFMPLLMQQKEYVDKIGKDKIDKVMETGMLVLDIGKLLGGNIMEGLLFSADPNGAVTDGNSFVGSIARASLGDNPSNFVRIITLTAANASLDSFMPIPLNCSHYLQLVMSNNEYTVK